ncbi:hypothetical protein DPMN_090056 [Dreissena polymorpha]|uniref:Uncharacterized protein n=1 Tax=Dreissena polymorpha TaxID=45954 RepID=A0A9D4QZG3_DREPO|nr:hypothetical protein DPMN_090056 [Dreissena polymorpha]
MASYPCVGCACNAIGVTDGNIANVAQGVGVGTGDGLGKSSDLQRITTTRSAKWVSASKCVQCIKRSLGPFVCIHKTSSDLLSIDQSAQLLTFIRFREVDIKRVF